MRTVWCWAALGLAGLWACSGSSTTSNPPPTTSVASIEVTPSSGVLTVPATLQLTATPRDAAGAAISGLTIAWSSSAPAVATVSGAGLVTAVSGGNATITASAGGKQGQASISVASTTSSPYGPVVSHADIGAAGGTVATAEIGVTIPAGALSTSRTVQLIRDTISPNAYGASTASERYFVNGLPPGVTVQTRVRIRTTAANSGLGAIAVLRPGLEMGDTMAVGMGLRLVQAEDSAGYLVATIPITGRTTWAGTPPMFLRGSAARTPAGLANAFDPQQLVADAELVALLNLSRTTAVFDRYEIWGLGGGADMPAKVTRTAALIEQANTTLLDLGYRFGFRTSWPIQVFIYGINANGIFTLTGPWPQDLNASYISYNRNNTELDWYPGTVIHEMFHFAKSGIFPLNNNADWVRKGWLDEATSTWVAGKHPAVGQPFINPTALAWRDSLFSGLGDGMVSMSGYGKAPIIKYVANRWGDAKIKEILDATSGGADPTTAFLGGIPEAPRLWWPNFLIEFFGGSIYPWSVQQLVPENSKIVNLELGTTPAWITRPLHALGLEAVLLTRDTAMFGPDFTLPVHLNPADIGAVSMVVLQKSAASANFRPLGTGDTVMIPGYLLQRPDSILLLVSPTNPAPPYNATRVVGFVTDLHVPEADWYFPTVKDLNSTVAFSCDKPGNTVSMDMASNATSVWNLFSTAGTWKKSGTGNLKSVIHTWAPTPAWADTIAKYHLTMQSTLTTGARGDTIRLQARLAMNTASSLRADRQSAPAGLGWWWLAPLAGVPVIFRKRTRKLGVALVAVALLVLVGCQIGQINFAIDETLDYEFTRMRFTANAAAPTDPLMQLTQGSGKTTLTSYRSEYWSYITDASGAKTDSVQVTCTGSGNATYTVDGTGYGDGVTAPSGSVLADAVGQILGRNPPALKATVMHQVR